MENGSSGTLRLGKTITESLLTSIGRDSFATQLYQYFSYDPYSYDYDGNIIGGGEDVNGLRTPILRDRNAIKGLADASFFPDGWWNNPFAPNLI